MIQPTQCRECGSTHLRWQTGNVIRSGIQQGLTTRDVECRFFLGCDFCCATLVNINADQVAELMNETAAKNQQAATA